MRRERDVYVGLDDPTREEWHAWYDAMKEEREAVLASSGLDSGLDSELDSGASEDPETAWSETARRQLFLFMYDTRFYDRTTDRYRTTELLERAVAMFGRIDSVLLWQGYPRLGFDSRTQFAFYRDMPGGIARLRAEVCDVLHGRGVRVFVAYNPWDAGTYEELGEIVSGLDADGVLLDTLSDAPDRLASAVTLRRKGVVFVPELTPPDASLGRFRQSWAQWLDIGDETTPSIYRQRWLVPRHVQLAIRRWDTSRRRDILYAFFNGAGLVLWDNVFGTWNPYSPVDRRLIAETAAIEDHYGHLFARGEWLPLVPTGTVGLDANRWNARADGEPRAIVTLRNRTKDVVRYRIPDDAPPGWVYASFWGEGGEHGPGDSVAIEPEGVQALVLDLPAKIRVAREHFRLLSTRAGVALPDYDARCPRPWPVRASGSESLRPAIAKRRGMDATSMLLIPGGHFEMSVRHERRECGCLPVGASDQAMWGWHYKDQLCHSLQLTMAPFRLRGAAVTNADFLSFVHDSGYVPRDRQRFLEHIARSVDGSLPAKLLPEQGVLPVTFVSLEDARAFAAWHAQRLPTEVEWQWAAEGAGAGNSYPWGATERSFPDAIRPALDSSTATPQGVMGLSGNAWEWTESEHTDGHTRFAMLRGGSHLPPAESEWLPARGPRPNDHHAKYLLSSDGLDRSEAISFRTAQDPGAPAQRRV